MPVRIKLAGLLKPRQMRGLQQAVSTPCDGGTRQLPGRRQARPSVKRVGRGNKANNIPRCCLERPGSVIPEATYCAPRLRLTVLVSDFVAPKPCGSYNG
jgi:hypothetical protein